MRSLKIINNIRSSILFSSFLTFFFFRTKLFLNRFFFSIYLFIKLFLSTSKINTLRVFKLIIDISFYSFRTRRYRSIHLRSFKSFSTSCHLNDKVLESRTHLLNLIYIFKLREIDLEYGLISKEYDIHIFESSFYFLRISVHKFIYDRYRIDILSV